VGFEEFSEELSVSVVSSQWGKTDALSANSVSLAPTADFFRRVLICLWHKTNPLGRSSTAKKSLIKYGGYPVLISSV
jgi:hypothetical protein